MSTFAWSDEALHDSVRAVIDCVKERSHGSAGFAWEAVEEEQRAAMTALAPHVEARLREARAEALSAEADGLSRLPHPDAPDTSPNDMAVWLRFRAEEVRRGE